MFIVGIFIHSVSFILPVKEFVCGFISLYLHHSCNSFFLCHLSRSYSFVSRFQFEYADTHTHINTQSQTVRWWYHKWPLTFLNCKAKYTALATNEMDKVSKKSKRGWYREKTTWSLIIVRRFPTCGKIFPVYLSRSLSTSLSPMSRSILLCAIRLLCQCWIHCESDSID